MLGLFCWFAVVSAALRPALSGVRCLRCLPGEDGRAGLPSACGAPPLCLGLVGRAGLLSACGAPPRVFVSRVSSPCRSCSPARPLLSCVCAALRRALVFGAASCCAPLTTPPHPSACCLLTPFASWCRMLAAVAPPPPPRGFHFATAGALVRVFPCSLCALWLLCAAWPFVGAPCSPPPQPRVCVSRVSSPCRLPSSVLLLPSGGSTPLGRLPPAPPDFVFRVLLLLPCAGWCWRAVLAFLVLCGAVLLLAVLCCSGCGVLCGVVPCLVVLRGWSGAALRFLVRLCPAACPAVLGGAVLCCRALHRSLGCCVLVLFAVLSSCVLVWVALCRLVSVGVVRLAV